MFEVDVKNMKKGRGGGGDQLGFGVLIQSKSLLKTSITQSFCLARTLLRPYFTTRSHDGSHIILDPVTDIWNAPKRGFKK